MAEADPVFLDANVIIYSLDETSQPYKQTVGAIQRLLDQGAELCTSHHVIEEVLHIIQKLGARGPADLVRFATIIRAAESR